MAKNKKINVQGLDIVIYQEKESDYISLTVLQGIKMPLIQIQLFKTG